MKIQRLLPVALVAFVTVACFGKVSVVPAAQAPKLAAGTGFSCFETVSRSQQPAFAKHTVRCARTEEQCRRASDTDRKNTAAYDHVGTCSAHDKAYCSATFTNENDAAWACYAVKDDCDGQVGGMSYGGGVKQSECAEYN